MLGVCRKRSVDSSVLEMETGFGCKEFSRQRAMSGRQSSFHRPVIRHHNPHLTAIADLLEYVHNEFISCLPFHNVIIGQSGKYDFKNQKEKASKMPVSVLINVRTHRALD